MGLFFITNLVILLGRKYAHLTVEISPKILEKLKTFFFNMLELREEKPGLFCGIISTVLVILAFIGHIISGTYIVIVLLIMALFIANKYEIRIVADRNEGKCVFFCRPWHSTYLCLIYLFIIFQFFDRYKIKLSIYSLYSILSTIFNCGTEFWDKYYSF